MVRCSPPSVSLFHSSSLHTLLTTLSGTSTAYPVFCCPAHCLFVCHCAEGKVPVLMSNPSLEPNKTVTDAKSAKPVTMLPWRRWLFAFDGYNLFSNTLFTSAIWVIYLAAHGYSPFAIGLLEMLFHIAKLVTEVPTGIFADLLGRRKSLIVAAIIQALEVLLFLVPTPPMMLLSFTLAGIAWAFRGGANTALLWGLAAFPDSEQQAVRYSKLVSRMILVGLIGVIIGTTTGGYLGTLLAVLPFICAAIVNALSIIPLLFIPEQRIPAQQRPNPWHHLRQGIRAVWHMPTLLGLLLISGLTDSCWQTIYFYYQLYLHGLGFSLSVIGFIVAGSTVSSFLFTITAPHVMRWLPLRWLPLRWLVPLFVIVEIGGLLLMSLPFPLVSIVGYLVLFQGSVAILTPAFITYINERSPEEQRATVLSLQTGLFSAAMIAFFPLFGLGVSHVSYSTVYLWTLYALAGSIAIAGIVVLLIKSRKTGSYHDAGER